MWTSGGRGGHDGQPEVAHMPTPSHPLAHLLAVSRTRSAWSHAARRPVFGPWRPKSTLPNTSGAPTNSIALKRLLAILASSKRNAVLCADKRNGEATPPRQSQAACFLRYTCASARASALEVFNLVFLVYRARAFYIGKVVRILTFSGSRLTFSGQS